MLEDFPKNIDVIAPDQPQVMFNGVFDLEELYNYIIKKLKKNKFKVEEPKHKNKVKELIEGEIHIEASKKELEFLKYKIKIKIFYTKCKLIESGKDNAYKKLEGYLEITLSSSVELDYNNRFSKDRGKLYYIAGKLYWWMRKMQILGDRIDGFEKYCIAFVEDIRRKLVGR